MRSDAVVADATRQEYTMPLQASKTTTVQRMNLRDVDKCAVHFVVTINLVKPRQILCETTLICTF